MRAALGFLLLVLSCEARPEPPRPCTHWLPPKVMGTLPDELDEVSGLVASRRNPGVLWAVEDSGGAPVVFGLDHGGRVVARLTLRDVVNVDWEALALGPCGAEQCLFIGDVGDNLAQRDDVAVLRVVEPVLAGTREREVTAERFPLRYPDGAQDAEALVVDEGGLPVVFTKRTDGTTRVFRFDALTGETLRALRNVDTSANVEGLPSAVTDASLWSDGKHLLLRTYGGAWQFALPGGIDAVADASGEAVPVPWEVQGESMAYDPRTGGFWTVSEGRQSALFHVACAE
ncbi:MAG: hypothetical protein AB2A00_35790 [Myxococcota bacterium]